MESTFNAIKLYRDDDHSTQFLILPIVSLDPVCDIFTVKIPKTLRVINLEKINIMRETMTDAMEGMIQQNITIF